MPLRFVIIGNPVAHSKSPEIHAAFARQFGIDLVYERLLVEPGGFAVAVQALQAAGVTGANVTLPFKVDAFEFATQRSQRALQAQAVNTLAFHADEVVGDNTDGVGLVRDIEQHCEYSLEGKRVLLLGAGGAARGVVGPLLDAAPASLVIANRTAARASEIAANFDAARVAALALTDLPGRTFDVVINATSASLAAGLPLVPAGVFASGALAYDMVYGKGATPFLQLARQAGARTADGLGMLVEQAAEGFFIWHGVRPDTQPVRAMLRGA